MSRTNDHSPDARASRAVVVRGMRRGPAMGRRRYAAALLATLVLGFTQVPVSGDGGANTWSRLGPTPRTALGVGVVNGVLYAVGGLRTPGFDLGEVEAWDPATVAWTTKAPMPTARSGLAIGVVGDVLYAVGGVQGDAIIGSGNKDVAYVEAYDPATGAWTSKANLPTARSWLGVGVVNGVLYAVGGAFGTAVEAYEPATDTWTPKAPMPTARSGLAVGVVNGVLYAIGGDNSSGFLSTVEAYDPVTNTWTTKAPMATARSGLAVGVVNGLLYAVGGNGSSGLLATVEVYDPTTNTWRAKAPMPAARAWLGVGVVSGIVYAVGGSHAPGASATVEAYDPAINMWTTKGAMRTPRSTLGVGVLNGVLYAVGGRAGYPYPSLPSAEAYDPATDTWTPKAPMPTARSGLGVGLANGVLYAVGGYNGEVLGTVEAYDPATDRWTSKAPMPIGRENLAVGVVNSVLYAVGGNNSSGEYATVEAYDPATNTWATKSPMLTARSGLAVGVVNGVLYAVGGYNDGGYRATAEAYDPATNTWTTKTSMPTARSGLAAGVINAVLYAVGGDIGGGILATVETYELNSAPTATNAAIGGTPKVGQTLTGSYTYGDVDGDPEGTSTFRWLRNGTAIGEALGPTYVVGLADVAQTLTFEVTPVAQTGPSPGVAATSAGLAIVSGSLTVTITTPTSAPTTTATQPFLRLGGTVVSANAHVARAPQPGTVTWASDRGPSGTARGTANWEAEVPLFAGTNVLTVTATDAVGESGTDTLTVTVSSFIYYLAEGATGPFFDLELALANPNTVAAPVAIQYLKEDGSTVDQSLTLGARSRQTILVDGLAGLGSTAVSSVVTSTDGLPLAVERTMTWDATGYGSHTEKATPGAAMTWYFAEGSEQVFFDTYLLLANPQSTANRATVQFLIEGGSPVTKVYTLLPTSRTNVFAQDVEDPPGTQVLLGKAFGMIVTFDQPGVAERAMYFGPSPFWNGGHESAGVTAPSTSWFHAEGATGSFFDTFILLSNPNSTPATVMLRFLLDSGATVTRTKTVAANARLTVGVESEDPLLADAAMATQVTSDLPIVSERAMYWTAYPNWYEAHTAFGVTSTGVTWALGEGRVGGASGYETYILLANPGTTAAGVTVTYLREGGLASIVQAYTVQATSRFNVYVNGVPGLGDGDRFGALIESTVPIVVERAMYSNATSQPGVVWAAGTNATGTPVP